MAMANTLAYDDMAAIVTVKKYSTGCKGQSHKTFLALIYAQLVVS
jgi:hypothetical protein